MIAVVILFAAYVLGFFNRPVTYVLPADYRGWVLIQYKDPSCPALQTYQFNLIITIPSSGCACTSSPSPPGMRRRRYEYVYPNGDRRGLPSRFGDDTSMIWGETGIANGPDLPGYRKYPRTAFFIGEKPAYLVQAKFNPLGPPFAETKTCRDLDEHGRAG
jgi:Family of unknown function (DUF6843)